MGGALRLANLSTSALPIPSSPALSLKDASYAWSPAVGGYTLSDLGGLFGDLGGLLGDLGGWFGDLGALLGDLGGFFGDLGGLLGDLGGLLGDQGGLCGDLGGFLGDLGGFCSPLRGRNGDCNRYQRHHGAGSELPQRGRTSSDNQEGLAPRKGRSRSPCHDVALGRIIVLCM